MISRLQYSMKEEQHSIPQENSSDQYNTSIIYSKDRSSIKSQFQIHQDKENLKWTKMAYTLIEKENPPPVFRLEPIVEKSPLKGTRLFDYFIARLKEWNSKAAKNGAGCNKKEISLFTFIYSHLKNLSRKPIDVQHSLLESLFAWYQESINPKPKISEILRGLKRKNTKVHTSEDESVRKTFNSNLSLKIDNFYRRQFGHSFNNQELKQMFKKSEKINNISLEQKLINKIKIKEENNLRTWREEKEMDSQIQMALQYRTRREQMGYKTMSGAFRSTARTKLQDPRPSSQQPEGELTKRRQITPRIGGMTLMINPFQLNKK